MEKNDKFYGAICAIAVILLMLSLKSSPAEENPEIRYRIENEMALAEMKSYMAEHPEEFVDEEEPEEVIESVKFTVTATVYNPTVSQCDASPLVTADQSKINLDKLEKGELKWIAVSRDLLEVFKYGDKVKLSGNDDIAGIYEIHDTMNKRYTNYIDILMPESIKLGKWKNITIEKVI